MSNSSGAVVLNLTPGPDYAELEKDPEYMQGLLKHAVSLAMKGFTINQIKVQTNYTGSTEQLLELIDEALIDDLRLYKTTYKARQIIGLNNDLQKLDDHIDGAKTGLIPSLMTTKLRVQQEMNRLLDEVTGNRKAVASIDFSIEGVDLSMI